MKILGLTSLANGDERMVYRTRSSFRTGATALALSMALVACSSSTDDAAAPADDAADSDAPVVNTAGGEVRGFVDEDISVFRGIPFAGDVSGQGRWRPAGPPPEWDGVRDATKHGPICPQSTREQNGEVEPWLAEFAMEEDCLNLSVYSPQPGSDAKAPVMVWLHGGFARIGSGSRYDGKALAQHDTVVVTINYRLDRLGLFAHPALSANQPDEALANYGLMDMAAALEWVQDNIQEFGGDPDKVTIFGQSSGGVAVTALMTSPMTSGLYHRAIAQSGAMANLEQERHVSEDYPGSPSLEKDGEALAEALDIDLDGDVPAQLRAQPWESIIAWSDTQAAGALVPVTDGRFLPANVDRTFAEGGQHPTPLMIGGTSWEESLVANFDLPLQTILRSVPVDEVRAAYPGVDDKTLVGEWFADSAFHGPARFLARQVADHGEPAWVYRFSHVSEGNPDNKPGAAHSDDIPYLFERLKQPSMTGDETGREMARVMTGYWTNFARTGDPNGPELPEWTAVGADGLDLMVLDVPPAMQTDPLSDRINYHLQRYEKILATPSP